MTYKVYEKYKDSNIDWINLIPDYWHTYKLKHVINEFVAGGTPKSSNDSFWDENNKGIPWIAIGDMTDNEYINTTSKSITREGLTDKNLRILKKGTLIYSIFASLGKTAILNIDATTNQAILGLIISNKIDNIYLKYYLGALQSTLSSYSNENTQENLNSNIVKNMEIGMPQSLEEQKQIANYLDKKTSKIDTTVAKNKELINLLEEKRTALINQVVTKGLNPEVPMKDSGIEWIGEIPEHWEIKSLKNVVNIIMGQSPDSNDINDEKKGFLFMQGNAEFTNLYPKPSEYCTAPKKISREGDILMSVRAPVGELNISDKRYGIGRGLCSIKAIKVESRFLWYYLIKSKGDFNYYSNGSTFDAITISNLSSFPIIIPPLHEQNQITSYLDKETSIIDKIIDKIKENINLLEEYKTSLIHHVVTGKIDVRGEEI